jgi:hypothetical protein
VTRGPAGYGRYNDDPAYVGCPRAKSGMSPCIARDGHLALCGDPPADCVGCGQQPGALLAELGGAWEPARRRLQAAGGFASPGEGADRLAELVRIATEPGPGPVT